MAQLKDAQDNLGHASHSPTLALSKKILDVTSFGPNWLSKTRKNKTSGLTLALYCKFTGFFLIQSKLALHREKKIGKSSPTLRFFSKFSLFFPISVQNGSPNKERECPVPNWLFSANFLFISWFSPNWLTEKMEKPPPEPALSRFPGKFLG